LKLLIIDGNILFTFIKKLNLSSDRVQMKVMRHEKTLRFCYETWLNRQILAEFSQKKLENNRRQIEPLI